MPKSKDGFEKGQTVLQREAERFVEYNCERNRVSYDRKKHFAIKDILRWMKTTKQFVLIAPIVKALAQRDVYTMEHSERVALMSYRCAMLIKMSKPYRRTIALSAYCHDIGKISIPDGILNKNGPLTDSEFDEIKQHPADGADILNKQLQYSHIIDGVLYHHERWNGRGYPSGLKGEDIPFSARIIAVADSIDAMMSDRPYRKALSKEECYNEIKSNSGIMYDPKIAQLYLDNWSYIVGEMYD